MRATKLVLTEIEISHKTRRFGIHRHVGNIHTNTTEPLAAIVSLFISIIIVENLPHSMSAFTQGLFNHNWRQHNRTMNPARRKCNLRI